MQMQHLIDIVYIYTITEKLWHLYVTGVWHVHGCAGLGCRQLARQA